MDPTLIGSLAAGAALGAGFAGAGFACAITIEALRRLTTKIKVVRTANFFILLLLSFCEKF
jgi:hypothetical protein